MTKVLVTGGAGFIGSHLLDSLLARGDDVTVVDNFSTGSAKNIMHISKQKFRLIGGDIRSRDSLDEVFDKPYNMAPYDFVFHLAAQTSVPCSVRSPRYDWDVNVRGFVGLLSRCLGQEKLPHVVFSSSAAVYGSNVKVPTVEDTLCFPESPYGASKLSGEHMLASFRSSEGLTSSVMRFSNVFGPRQTAEGEAGVVAIFTDRFRKRQEIGTYGDGEQTRDFVNVKDVVDALIHSADRRLDGTYNVSTNKATSVNCLIDCLGKISGFTPQVTRGPKREGDILHSRLDNSKLLATGWRPKVELLDGLRETYNYNVD